LKSLVISMINAPVQIVLFVDFAASEGHTYYQQLRWLLAEAPLAPSASKLLTIVGPHRKPGIMRKIITVGPTTADVMPMTFAGRALLSTLKSKCSARESLL